VHAGASGYALKHATGEALITALQEILQGVDLR
jgi:DNA-binding NarL/FixJ family response regulator